MRLATSLGLLFRTLAQIAKLGKKCATGFIGEVSRAGKMLFSWIDQNKRFQNQNMQNRKPTATTTSLFQRLIRAVLNGRCCSVTGQTELPDTLGLRFFGV